MSEQGKKGLSNFLPTQPFAAGLVGGLLLLCTVGFFILLGVFLKGDLNLGGETAEADENPSVAQEAEPAEQKVTVAPVDLNRDHVRGNENAKISIIEFSDSQCPFCSRFHTTMKQVVDTYGDNVRWVYRHFPLDQLHPNARTESMAAECAGEQGKFWEYLDTLYEDQDNKVADLTGKFATELGLDAGKLKTCLDSKKYADRVNADEDDAVAAGGRGTPYSVLVGPNGETEVISGAQPFESVEAVIQKYL